MNIVKQNPFRILGLLGNASEREIQKNIGVFKRFAEIGKSKTFDYDFNFIGDFSRRKEDIDLAASQIEQPQKKILYSLFWFVKYTQFDEIAFNNLKDNQIKKVVEIWRKTLTSEISNKNYSSYLNLSTLYIASSIFDEKLKIEPLQRGIELKERLIHSSSIRSLSKLVIGNGFVMDSTEISKKFVDEIIELLNPYLNKNNGLTTRKLISLFNSFPQNIQQYISSKFTAIPISNIENKIERISTQRKNNPRGAGEYGENLYQTTKKDIILLKTLLENGNIHIQMIANKLADEILQCSIDFFNRHREKDSDFDPGDDAFKIAKLAQSIGTSGQTKNRIEESLNFIQKWVVDKVERQKQKSIDEDLAYIRAYIERFQKASPTIKDSNAIIVACKPKLANIKKILGADDDFYLQVSTVVAQNALGMMVAVVNEAQKNIESSFPIIISSALSMLALMGSLDMDQEVRTQYYTNKRTILNIKKQLDATSKTTPGYTSQEDFPNSDSIISSDVPVGKMFLIIFGGLIAIGVISSNYDSILTSQNTNKKTYEYSSQQKSPIVPKPQPVESKYKGNKLENGASPYNKFFGRGIYNQNQKNWIKFKNGYNTDAIVCLVNYHSGQVTRNEYIQAGTSFQMTKIPNGTYYMKVFSGKDWNPTKSLNGGKIVGGFDTDISFYKSKNNRDLLRLNDDGYKYSTGEITLYKVSSGNMQTQTITEGSFFD